MHCPNPKCKNEITETTRFCDECGAQIRRNRSHNVVAAVGRGLVPGEIFKFRYRIEGFLGYGGATVSYMARDQEFADLPVVLKILPGEIVLDDEVRNQLAMEARASLSLVHENIARFYYMLGKAQVTFLVSEYVNGPSLEQQRRQEVTADGFERWPLPKALDLLMPVAEGLDYAHERGIVHRELKPSNIILCPKNGKVVPKILDFGVSAVIRDGIDAQDGMIPVESRFYVAPERLMKEAVSPASDVYSLGLILYQLLTGSLPFKLSDWEKKVTGEESPAPIDEIGREVNEAILRSLIAQPERRYASAVQFLSAVRSTAGLGPPAEIRIVAPEPPKRKEEPRPVHQRDAMSRANDLPLFLWVLGAVLGGMLLGAAMVLHFVKSDDVKPPVLSSGGESPASTPLPAETPASVDPTPETSLAATPSFVEPVVTPIEPVASPTEVAGPITFETVPPGAEVQVNKRSTGATTPCTLSGIPAGDVEFTFVHPECEVLVREEVLEADRPVLYQVALAPFEVVKSDDVAPGIPRFKNLKDDSRMVLVPGTDTLIDETEITNAQYRKFVEETGYRKPAYADNPRYSEPELPVVGVSWKDAIAYCQWAGKNLPSEKLWETAARGGLQDKTYPWGDDDPQGRAQFGEDNATGQAKPTKSFEANPYGLFDMAGNVWELCMEEDPEKPGFRAIRGGSFLQTKEAIGITSRNMLKENFIDSTAVGFRCVKRLPPSLLEKERGKATEPPGGAGPGPTTSEPWPGAIPSSESSGSSVSSEITTQTVTSGSIGNL